MTRERKAIKQIAVNAIRGGVANTIICGLHKAGVANILPYKSQNQHYTSSMIIYDKADSNKLV